MISARSPFVEPHVRLQSTVLELVGHKTEAVLIVGIKKVEFKVRYDEKSSRLFDNFNYSHDFEKAMSL